MWAHLKRAFLSGFACVDRYCPQIVPKVCEPLKSWRLCRYSCVHACFLRPSRVRSEAAPAVASRCVKVLQMDGPRRRTELSPLLLEARPQTAEAAALSLSKAVYFRTRARPLGRIRWRAAWLLFGTNAFALGRALACVTSHAHDAARWPEACAECMEQQLWHCEVRPLLSRAFSVCSMTSTWLVMRAPGCYCAGRFKRAISSRLAQASTCTYCRTFRGS